MRAGWIDSPRVDEEEVPPAPLGFRVVPVPREPRELVHDGAALAEETVEEGRLSDVRTADDRDDGEHGMAPYGLGDASNPI